ncbi:MAG: DMT family transporter [Candidatus Brocadiae bacterium]|nr:DMT family transporter [Candidatus Brocadiia bacterium]
MTQPGQEWTDRERRRASVALVFATLFWGATFFLMKDGSVAIGRILGPEGARWSETVFLVLRFALAAALFPLAFPRVLRASREAWMWGAVTAIPFSGGFLLQIYGLASVDPSISALYTSMFVVFTPALMFLIFRRPVGRNLALGIGLVVAGLWLTTGAGPTGFGLGELLSLGCAFVFSFHIILTDLGTRRADPIAIAWTCITLATVLCALPLAVFHPAAFAAVPAALGDRTVLVGVGFTATLATLGSIGLMNTFQRRLTPNSAAVIYTLEPVFAGLFSWWFFGERFEGPKLFGGSLVIAGNLVAALRASRPPAPVSGPAASA